MIVPFISETHNLCSGLWLNPSDVSWATYMIRYFKLHHWFLFMFRKLLSLTQWAFHITFFPYYTFALVNGSLYIYWSRVLYLFRYTFHLMIYWWRIHWSLFVFITIEFWLIGKTSCSHLLCLQRTFLRPVWSPTLGVLIYSGFIFSNPVPSDRLSVLS